MKTVFIICAVVMIFCASCTKKEDKEKEFVNTIFYPSNETPCIESTKIVYHNRLEPTRLNKEQLQKVSDYIRHCNMEVSKVWFCRVFYNNSVIFTVNVYFAPTENSQRIKKGKYLFYHSEISDLLINRHSEYIPDYLKERIKLPEYVYVADMEPSVSEISDIGSSPQLIPFDSPEGFADQEIIEIVDFIRSGPTLKREKENEYTLYFPGKVDTELPICFIRKTEDGNIEVQTGTQEGPMSGSGQSLTIKKIEREFELIALGMWNS